MSKENLNILSNKDKNKYKEIENKILNTTNKKDFDNLLKQYFKINKGYLDKHPSFIKEANWLCSDNIYFNLVKCHINNLYPEFKRELFPKTIDEYYKYSLDIEGIGFLYRFAGYVNLLSIKNEMILSKLLFFFRIWYDIKRTIVSHHLLLEATFVTIESF